VQWRCGEGGVVRKENAKKKDTEEQKKKPCNFNPYGVLGKGHNICQHQQKQFRPWIEP